MIDPAQTDVLRRRILASLIDLAIVAGLTALVARIVAVTFLVTHSPEGARFGTAAEYDRYYALTDGFARRQVFGDTWYVWDLGRLALIAVIAVLLTLLIWVVLPSRTDQSPGKALFGLRVTDLLGETADTTQHVTRTVFGVVDALPYVVPGLLGWVLALSAEHRQRIGDRLAQTVVIDAKATRPSKAGTAKTSTATTGAAADPAAGRVIRPEPGRLADKMAAATPDTDHATEPAEPPSTPTVEPEPAPEPAASEAPSVEQLTATIAETVAVVETDGGADDLFDDNAPIDIERPGDDLPTRRRTAAPAEIPPGLLAADNGADLTPEAEPPPAAAPAPTPAPVPARDRLEQAAWERPVAEPAPVWRPSESERPLVDPSLDAARAATGQDRPGLGGVVPSPVALDFTDEQREDEQGHVAVSGEPTPADAARSVETAPPVDDFVSPEELFAAIDDDGETPAPAASGDDGGSPAADPLTPTWSEEWKSWVVFDPARNAWLRHDAEQDLWLEL